MVVRFLRTGLHHSILTWERQSLMLGVQRFVPSIQIDEILSVQSVPGARTPTTP